MPDLAWRRTNSEDSAEDSEADDQGGSADLVDAAMFLLEDAKLAGAAESPEEEQSAPAARDWGELVEKWAAVKPKAVASSRLLAMRNAVPSPSARMVFQSQVSLC